MAGANSAFYFVVFPGLVVGFVRKVVRIVDAVFDDDAGVIVPGFGRAVFDEWVEAEAFGGFLGAVGGTDSDFTVVADHFHFEG